MELIGDICQLSLSDLIELSIAYIEHADIGCNFVCDDDIVTEYFNGKTAGWRAIEIIRHQRAEVMSYIPQDTAEMHYLRSHRDGVYVYARTSDNVNAGQSNVLS